MAYVFNPKNLSKTIPKRGPNPSKIDAKNVLFFNIDFFGFRPRFWRLLGLQVRRAACSARRVRAYRILCLHEHTAFPFLGKARILRNGGRNSDCWAHVGSFFALGCIFFAFGRFWNAPWIFFAHVNFFSGVGVAQNSILVGARRGRPHGMDMCLDIPAWIPLGDARASKLQTKILSW